MRTAILCLLLVAAVATGCGRPHDFLERQPSMLLNDFQLVPSGRFRIYESPMDSHFSPVIATGPVRDPCKRTATKTTCRDFLATSLAPRGVMAMAFYGGGSRSWEQDASGEPLMVAGHEALILRMPGACREFGGDLVLVVQIRSAGRPDFTGLWACLRGPDLPVVEAELLAFLDTATPAR